LSIRKVIIFAGVTLLITCTPWESLLEAMFTLDLFLVSDPKVPGSPSEEQTPIRRNLETPRG